MAFLKAKKPQPNINKQTDQKKPLIVHFCLKPVWYCYNL